LIKDVARWMLMDLVGTDLEEPFFARIEAARLRQEAKMREIKEAPVAEASDATKVSTEAPATLAKRPLGNGVRTTGTTGTTGSRPTTTQTRTTGPVVNQARASRPIVTQSRITTTRPTASSATSTTRPGTLVRKPNTEESATSKTRTVTIPNRKPLVPTVRPRDQTTIRPVSSTTTRPASSTTSLPGSRPLHRSTTTTRPVTDTKRPVIGRARPAIPAIQEEKNALEIPSTEVFEVADLGSELEDEVATLDFVL
jgi:hypothetical protein